MFFGSLVEAALPSYLEELAVTAIFFTALLITKWRVKDRNMGT